MQTVAVLLMLIVALFQSSVSAISKFLHYSLPTEIITLFYYLIPFLFFLPHIVKNRLVAYKTSYTSLYVIRSLFSVTSVICFFYVASVINLGEANVLFVTSPIFVAILSSIFLKEPITKIGFLGIILAFIGVYCIIKPESLQLINIGFFLGLMSGVLMSISQIILKYLVGQKEPTMRVVFYQYCYCALAIIIFIFIKFLINGFNLDLMYRPTVVVYILLIVLGLLSIVGQTMMTRAFKYMPASKLSPILYASVPISSIIGYILWSQLIHFNFVIGSILIFMGILFNIYFKR
ncbi:MAG: DMT family transporter [Pseudomonadota bacterium]